MCYPQCDPRPRHSSSAASRPHDGDFSTLLHRGTLVGIREVRSGRSPSCGGWGREGVRSELASGATTGPRGAAGPHNPESDVARGAPPNPELVRRFSSGEGERLGGGVGYLSADRQGAGGTWTGVVAD